MPPRLAQNLALFALALVPALHLLSCSTPSGDKAPDPEAARVVAELGGEEITLGELEDWIKEDWWVRTTSDQDPFERYAFQETSLDRMIRERLLLAEAERRSMTGPQLWEAITGPAAEVKDEDVRSFYEEHEEEAGGRPYEQVEGAIREELSRRQRGAVWESFVAGLHEAHPSQVRLEPPRVQVEATGPARGPETAPVTIVTFSDYNCPYCKQSNAVMDEVLTRYPEQVRLVLRHYPLDSLHPRARAAAEAAACADEQGRFWDYHERLFQIFMAMPGDALTSLAGELALDRAAFESCLVERRTQAVVERDVEAGQRAGVRGTPAFFVNGIRLTGSQSVEALQRVIDEELERQAAKTS